MRACEGAGKKGRETVRMQRDVAVLFFSERVPKEQKLLVGNVKESMRTAAPQLTAKFANFNLLGVGGDAGSYCPPVLVLMPQWVVSRCLL